MGHNTNTDAEARDLQDQEVMLLECVYDGEDLVVVREGGGEGGAEGRVQRVECTLMRTCPTAVVLTPQERRQYAAAVSGSSSSGSGAITPLVHEGKTVPYDSIVWASPEQEQPSGDGEGGTDPSSPSSSSKPLASSSSASVPVGYIIDRPMLVTLSLTIPRMYPFEALRHWRVDCNKLSKEELAEIGGAIGELVRELTGGGVGSGGDNDATTSDTATSSADGSPMIQIIVETARDHLAALKREEAEDAMGRAVDKVKRSGAAKGNKGSGKSTGDDDDDDDGDFDEEAALLTYQHHSLDTKVLGRRCVYYHHILSSYKRCVIMNMARRLDLRGFCKIGYPGILVVEGSEEACEFYVQCLQRLRWKLMVVRGEERIEAPQGYHALRVVTATNLRPLFGGSAPPRPITDPTAAQSSSSSSQQKKGKSSSSSNSNSKGGSNSGAQKKLPAAHYYDDDDEGASALSAAAKVDLDATRKAEQLLASRPILETGSSDEIAAWCNMCGLSVLFRTVMKIYS